MQQPDIRPVPPPQAAPAKPLGKAMAASMPPHAPPPERLRPPFHIPPILLEGDEPSPIVSPVSLPGKRRPPDLPAISNAAVTGTRTVLSLTARDPFCLYATWDLGPDRQQRLNALSSEGRLVLRPIMESGERLPQAEIRLNPTSNHWFVDVTSSGATYTLHLGFYDEQRVWCEVARSQQVTTPPNEVSQIAAGNITRPSPAPLAELSPAPAPAPAPAIQAPAELREAQVKASTVMRGHVGPIAPAETNGNIQILAASAGQDDAPAPGAAAQAIAAPGEKSATLPQRARIKVPPPLRRGPPAVALAPSQKSEMETDLARGLASESVLYALASGAEKPAFGISSADQARSEAPSAGGEVSSPAPLPHGFSALRKGEADQLSSPGAEFVPSQAPNPRDFWFRVNAELVIYGATMPDAKVAISGRPIRLRPDGTFSYRFALPDGQYQLRVVAVSPDGIEEREADLQFKRATARGGDVGVVVQDSALAAPKAENL